MVFLLYLLVGLTLVAHGIETITFEQTMILLLFCIFFKLNN